MDHTSRCRMADAVAAHLPDSIELWRDPDVTASPTAPIANRDEFGFPIHTSAPLQVATGARKIDECRGQLAPSPAKKGRIVPGATQIVPVAPWVISVPFYKVALWELSIGDELRTKGRAFQIVDAGGEDSFSSLRLVYCEEIG